MNNTVIYALQDTSGNYHGVGRRKKDIIPLQRELRQCGIKTEIKEMETMTRKEYQDGFKKGFNRQLKFDV